VGVLHSINIADPLLGNQGGGPVVINSDTPHCGCQRLPLGTPLGWGGGGGFLTPIILGFQIFFTRLII